MDTIVTLDLETTGLDFQKDKTLLIGYSENNGAVDQVSVRGGLDRHGPERHLFALLRLQHTTLRGHNIKFDAHFLRARGYDINCKLQDTKVLAYCTWPDEESHSLKHLVKTKLGRPVTELSDILFKPLKKELVHLESFAEGYYQIGDRWVRKDLLLPYHRADIENVNLLYNIMPENRWFNEVEMPLTRMIFEMEAYGCPLDLKHLERLKDEFGRKAKVLELKLGANDNFNPGSSQQVAQKLKDLGHNLEEIAEKTEKGSYQIDKALLKKLSHQGDQFCKDLLEYRKVTKNLTTYIDPFLERAGLTGRLHGSFNQAGSEDIYGDGSRGTRTGRLSSSDPNLQNIPSRTAEGRLVRKAFIAVPGEFQFDADLKQIEPRLVGHYSQSPKLIHAYNNGLDTHGLMACLIFGKGKVEELDPIERFIGKSSWLASVYGCSYKKLLFICENFSEGPLDLPLDKFRGHWGWLSIRERQNLIRRYGKEVEGLYPKWMFFKHVQDKFWEANPEIQAWRDAHLARTRRLGYVITIGGRVIKINGLDSNDRKIKASAERAAINYQIQGSAADVMKLIMLNFQRKMVDTGKAKAYAVIHDELLGSLRNKEDLAGVKEAMETAVKLRNIPVEADAKLVTSWGDK